MYIFLENVVCLRFKYNYKKYNFLIINKKRLHFAYYNWEREIQWRVHKFQDVRFQWTKRSANKVADRLAKRLEDGNDFMFYFYVPQFLNLLLHEDHIHSS